MNFSGASRTKKISLGGRSSASESRQQVRCLNTGAVCADLAGNEMVIPVMLGLPKRLSTADP